MKVTFLGTGTSQGVPVIACECEVCMSNDEKDKRLRCSVLIELDGKNVVIDTGPDFRQQMLRANVHSLDAILFTHEHKDHLAGLDDVRAFNFKQKAKMQVFASSRVQEALKREFHYVFSDYKYPGIPEIELNTIDNQPFVAAGIPVLPIEVLHYKLPVFGFRIGDFTYITDAKTIGEEEKEKIKGSKIIVLNALRRTEHVSHFTFDEAISMMQELQPEKGYLVHMSHYLGKHVDVESELPENIRLAYDGLEVKL